MKWNAFDYIGGSIERTKNLLFPIKPKYWFKLAIVVLISNLAKNQGGNGGNSFRVPSRGKGLDNITGNAVSDLNNKFLSSNIPLIGFVILLLFILGLIINFISSIFSFIFLEAVLDKKKQLFIKKSFSKNIHHGLSLFLFRILLGIVSLVLIALIALPYIFAFFNKTITSPFFGVGIIYILLTVLFIIILIIIIALITLFLYDFIIPEMYLKNKNMRTSWKSVLGKIGNNKMEVFIYIVAKIVLGIAAGIISALIALILLIPFIIIGLLAGVSLYLLAKALSSLILTIFLVILLIIFILFFVYLVTVVTLPIPLFFRYYSLDIYQKLMKS